MSDAGVREVCARLKNDGDVGKVIQRKEGAGRKFSAEKAGEVLEAAGRTTKLPSAESQRA